MRNNYRISDMLGQGAYGEVRMCVYKEDMKDKRSSVKDHRAVKILSQNYMEDKERASFKNEVACMKNLDHPNIIKMHHFYDEQTRFLLITETCKGGDLYEHIKDNGKLLVKEASICMK